MQLGRLGAWYSTDKLGGPAQIREFATAPKLEQLWLRHALVSGIPRI